MTQLLLRNSGVAVLAVLLSALATACTGAPGGIPQATASPSATVSPSLPTCEVSSDPSLQKCTAGRMLASTEGFAISLADGWDLLYGSDLETFYMAHGVVWADDNRGSSIRVIALPMSQFESDPAAAADPVGATVKALLPGMPGGQSNPMPLDPASPTNKPGSTTRSAVNLPAGPAVRLDGVVEGGRNSTAWVVGGGFYGYECKVQGAVFVVLAGFDDPAVLPILEQMAQSLELLPREQVLGAQDCAPAP